VYAASVQVSPFSYRLCCPGEWLWVDSNGTDEKPTFHRRGNLSWFSKICNHFREIAAWSRKSLTMITVFWKKDPLRASFQKIIPKGFTMSQNHVLCANFVKFGWPEIGKVVCCLPDKKTKLPQGLPLSLLRGWRPKSVRASCKQYTRSSPNFIQIRSLPAKLYSRTREHRWNAPQSISNTRRSFFAE